jgi:CheY-like chemotaxis protein
LTRQTFDVLLLDVMMPGMDGLQVLHWIHHQVVLNSHGLPLILPAPPLQAPLVVVVSAHTMPEEVLRLKQAGAQKVLPKPLVKTALDEILSEATRRKIKSGSEPRRGS